MNALPPNDIEPIRLPRNVEAEAALLGALMIENNLIPRATELVEVEDFFEPLHGRIFSAIIEQASRGAIANPVTLKPYLEADPALQELGGPGYLAQMTGTGNLIGAFDFASQISWLGKRRRLIVAMQATIERAAETSEFQPIEALVEDIDQGVTAALSQRDRSHAMTFSRAFEKTIETLEAAAAGDVEPGMRVSGFNEWNRVTGLMRAGQSIILAGRPSMGKTAVALAVALAAARAGIGTLFISLEMSVEDLMTRAIADLLFERGVSASYDQVKRGDFAAYDRLKLQEIREEIASWPLEIIDLSNLKAHRLPMLVRQYQRRAAAKGHELKLVITDYMQLMKASGRHERKHDAIDEISKTVKQTAKECGVCMVTLSQLSRGVEAREDKRPMLSDLRESGSIEEDADTVVFVYRAEYYLERSEPAKDDKRHADWEQQFGASRDRVQLIGAKLRNGRIQTRGCFFFSANQAVRDGDFFDNGG